MGHGDQRSKLPRWSKPAAWLAGFAILGGAGGWLAWNAFADEPNARPTAGPTPGPTPSPEASVLPIPQDPSEVGVPLAEAGCTPVESPKVQRPEIVSELGTYEYNTSPPTSGGYQGPPPAALYYVPISPESAVGAMANGAVIVWHTGLTFDETQLLHGLFIHFNDELIFGANGENLKLKQPIVLSAWGKLQRCDEISGEAIAEFLETYKGNGPLG